MEQGESRGESRGVERISDGGGRSSVWTEVSQQNMPGGATSSVESASFSRGVGGTSDAAIDKDGITFTAFGGDKQKSTFNAFGGDQQQTAQRTDGVTTEVTAEGTEFSANRTDYPDGSARASISDFKSITDVDIRPDGQLQGIDTLRSDGRPSQRESGDDLKDKFVPNNGPDGKPDGTSTYITPDGVRIDKGGCGEVIGVSKDGQSVYSRSSSQCIS